jgi:spore maturation protein CgeB
MHRRFYNHQRFTLNVTRADMVASGYSPSVRLFEAAACGVTIITDPWAGLEEFFEPGREILIAHSTAGVLEILHNAPETELRKIGARARQRVLAYHTADHRAQELERHVDELRGGARPSADWRPSQADHAGVVAV